MGLPVGDVGEGETVSVGDGVGVGDGDSVGVVVAEGVGDSVITGALGITEGKGCGGGGSDQDNATKTLSPSFIRVRAWASRPSMPNRRLVVSLSFG